MNLKDWRDAGDFFRHGHNPIFFRSGKPAQEVTLLLHGFPTASFDFHKIWDGLSNSFPLLAVDMIGYGFSAKPRDLDYTTFLQTDVIESLVRHAGDHVSVAAISSVMIPASVPKDSDRAGDRTSSAACVVPSIPR